MSMPIVAHFSYPLEFVERIKHAFPHDQELHAQLDSGSVYYVEEKLKRESPLLHTEFQELWQHRGELGRSVQLFGV